MSLNQSRQYLFLVARVAASSPLWMSTYLLPLELLVSPLGLCLVFHQLSLVAIISLPLISLHVGSRLPAFLLLPLLVRLRLGLARGERLLEVAAGAAPILLLLLVLGHLSALELQGAPSAEGRVFVGRHGGRESRQ